MKKLLPLLLLLFSTLYASTTALPTLVPQGESLKGFNNNYYIDNRSPINAIAISEDGKYIVSGSSDKSIKIWDRSTGELERSLTGHTGSIYSVAISRDGKTIVSGSSDKSIKIWDRSTGELERSLTGHTGSIYSVAISRDGKTIVSGSSDKSIKIWDRSTGELERSLTGHTGSIYSVAISRDGKTIVSGSDDKSIKIWDRSTGELERSLTGHTNWVRSVAISRDGKTIVSGSDDKSIKIWDRSTGELERSLTGHDSLVLSVAISRDGKTVVSGSYDKSIKIWDSNKTSALKSLIGVQRGNWLVKNHEEANFTRGDDGTLLLAKKTFKAVQAQWYVTQKSVDDINLSMEKRHLKFNNNEKAKLVLQLKNLDQNISVLSLKGESKHLLVIPKRVGVLKASETRDVALDVFAKVSRDDPKFIENEELNLTCTTPKGQVFNLTVFVSIDFSTLKVESAVLSKDEKTFSVKVRNVGNKALAKAKVKLEAPFSAASQDLENLEVDGNKTFLFSVPPDVNISINEKSLFKFSVSIANEKEILRNPAGTKIAPAYVWHFDNGHVTISLDKLAWYIYALWVLTGLVVLGLIFYFRRYRNTLVLQLQNNPKSLLTLSPILLSEAKEKLLKINELESVLKTLDIKPKTFDQALAFFESSEEEQVNLLSKKLEATYQKEGEYYRVNLPEAFNLNSINSFLVYLSDASASSISKKVIGKQEKVLVLCESSEQNAVAKKAHEKTNFMIAPTVEQLTELLLASEAQELLIEIFADCLLAKEVSPYQTNGDIKNESNFFGRVEIIRDILGSNKNYLIVGSRQLGKSSVLRALKRRYDEHDHVEAYYITMDDEQILLEMKNALGLEESLELKEMVSYLSQKEKKSIFLIDEADEFIAADAENDYKVTKAFRKLAQEGKATFVITGFWTMYYYVTNDYHAPFRNFGELVKLGGLDDEACRDLMVEPMKRIGIKYENEAMIDQLIKRCGNRANLIAITCHEVLKVLDGNVISQENIEQVIRHSTLEDYLKGWQTISLNEEENTLDRAILFLTLNEEQFRLGDVLVLLAGVGLASADENKVNESLERLVIGYFLEKDRGNYSYRVPLFKEKLLYEDIEVLLKREVRKLSKIIDVN
ncbi:MAG: High-affnity carbon uptake protein Hat/HatR [uncultured Sulfurovum sp.]|uniref:High-affnity carbon uptake protein Hat/HatR n=1 Tax=uncultured Sulfurovum sp. TaxID=269237 RepID=A0A6S6SPQ3_9BACT|nr:MAG: High-affnity carbon uptake protein Hat/HatR [uncultured Sulfurovum sp.]